MGEKFSGGWEGWSVQIQNAIQIAGPCLNADLRRIGVRPPCASAFLIVCRCHNDGPDETADRPACQIGISGRPLALAVSIEIRRVLILFARLLLLSKSQS